MQVGETVKRFLGSVSRITAAGNTVVFNPPGYGSEIYNWKTGKSTPLRQKDGVYLLDLWIKVPKSENQGFTGPEKR